MTLESSARTGGADLLYRSASVHSRRVRRLKVLLPMAALLISIGFVVVSWISAMFPESLSISGAMIENGKVVMERPAISGRNKDGISYFMNARRALQDIINPNDLTLEDIKASMPVRGDLIARVEAKSAHFNRAKDMLDLSDPFTIRLTSGLTANFRSAHLDIDGGKMNTEEPVSITAKEASITADSLKMTDKGRVIVFYGHVRVNVDPAAIRAKDK